MKLDIINPKYIEVEELYIHDPKSNMILEAGVGGYRGGQVYRDKENGDNILAFRGSVVAYEIGQEIRLILHMDQILAIVEPDDGMQMLTESELKEANLEKIKRLKTDGPTHK